MIVKNYKSNGEEITYTLDYDLFSVNVEHKKINTGVVVTDLTDLFGWLEEQGASVDPLKKFLEYQKLFDKNISDRLKKVEERAKR